MAIAANVQSGGLAQGAPAIKSLPPAATPPPGVELETPEGVRAAAAKAKVAGGVKAASLPPGTASAQAAPAATVPPGAEWEAPEGVKAAKVAATKTAAAKGTVTTNALNTKNAAVATSKAATGKTLVSAAAGTKGALAVAPGSIAVKGVTTGGSLWSGSLPTLGISLGGMTPLLVAGAAAALGIGIYSYLKHKKGSINELDEAIS
ncbi:MAG: hypothetical protein HQL73_12390 [Magnetococcales bacterium]|nr:hypothetical protein [Magnetococcales bacterium]